MVKKKAINLAREDRLKLIESDRPDITVIRQCDLLQLPRSSFYYKPKGEDEYNQILMNRIDEINTEYPFYGYPRMTAELRREGYNINEKRISRLMGVMGIEAIYPKANLSKRNFDHKVYPYLLKNKVITGVNEVWGTDITYIRLRSGFVYLVALIDWFSRFVLNWVVSTSLDLIFCLECLKEAIDVYGVPLIHNSDQGSHFTSNDYTGLLNTNGIEISMDSRGRALDNIFTERLWRSLKYEEVYLKDYENVEVAKESIGKYFNFYNYRRLHQSLGYMTPAEIYQKNRNIL